MLNCNLLFAGIDVGSLSAEAVILDQKGDILSGEIIKVRPRPLQSAQEVFGNALTSAGLTKDQIDLCYATGYGRDTISFAEKNISEISCHGKGAHHLASHVSTVIDIGGQDCKVIRVDSEGFLIDFVMNEKCAAGTGRFLEMMAKTLRVEIAELGQLALKSRNPLPMSSRCSIFAEIEVLQLLYSGKKKKDIAAGIHASLSKRIKTLTSGVGLNGNVCMTGGVSKNSGMVSMLEKELNVTFQLLSMDPQLIGALGAGLFARDAWKNEKRGNA